jgi:hypothetical protein
MGNINIPKYSGAYGKVYLTKPDAGTAKKPPTVKLSVQVNDKSVRENGVDFDGLEKAFALVPTRNNSNGIEWKRIDLEFQGTRTDRAGQSWDAHNVTVNTSAFTVREEDLRTLGVAFGLETKNGRGQGDNVWLQNSGNNFKPDDY